MHVTCLPDKSQLCKNKAHLTLKYYPVFRNMPGMYAPLLNKTNAQIRFHTNLYHYGLPKLSGPGCIKRLRPILGINNNRNNLISIVITPSPRR